MNLSETIIPKSDQLNYEDFISGPKTVKVTAVNKGSAEQPVVLRYEGDSGHPYKPSKTQRRILVKCWGDDGSAYIGRRIGLVGDPSIVYGGKAVGGIRISHLSDIPEAVELMLTVTRGQKKLFRVDPLPPEKAAAPVATISAADLAPYEITGREQAQLGNDALATWWASVPGKIKVALKPKLDADWKPIAAAVGGAS